MINTQIKSHWKLASRALIKAATVTISITFSYFRAKFYLVKNADRLEDDRRASIKFFNDLSEEYFDKI